MFNQIENLPPLKDEEDLLGEDPFTKLSGSIPERNMTPEEIDQFGNFFGTPPIMKPDMISVDKMLLLDIIDTLKSGLESLKEELVRYDESHGRNTRRDRVYAIALENEIRKTTLVLNKTKSTVYNFYEKEDTKNSPDANI